MCRIIEIVYVTHFKGHLEIYALTSCSLTSSSTAKFFFFPYKNFIEKNKTFTYDHHNLCSIILHQYHFAAITNFSILSFFFIHPEPFIGVLQKRLFEFLEHPSINSISKKNGFSENFGKHSSKIFILKSFIQVPLQAFLLCERPLALKGSHSF